QYGRAVLAYQGRTATTGATEDEIAGGILRVLRGHARRIAFTTGHGERTPGGEGEGYGRLASALANENYAPEGLSLRDGDVPEGVTMLVLAGPQRDLDADELAALARYLGRGGGVLMLLDPAPLPNLGRLLASLGIALGDDVVVDRERRILGTEGSAAVVELFK